MLFKTSTAELINSLLNEKNARESKIEEAIASLDKQIEGLEKNIDSLIDKCVSLELDGTTPEAEEIDKSIAEMRREIDILKGKREAYRRQLSGDKYIRREIPKILEAARRDRDQRLKQYEKKLAESDTLKNKIAELQKKLNIVEDEVINLRHDKEVQDLRPILKYIEPRKIKLMNEDRYLRNLLAGEPKQCLEQCIETVTAEPEVDRNVTQLNYQPDNIKHEHTIPDQDQQAETIIKRNVFKVRHSEDIYGGER